MSRAVQAQGWYLANLLLLPGISFVVLLVLYLKNVSGFASKIRDASDLTFDETLAPQARRLLEKNIPPLELDASHIRAALWLSVIGGSLVLGGASSLYLFAGNNAQAWTLIILYFTVMHTSFVMWGIFNLARAMSNRLPFFKII